MIKSSIERFILKIKQSDSCWIWIGTKDSSGYGQFGYNKKNVRAHRFSYELFIDNIPDGLIIDHLCRNRLCVNPKHLEPVTYKENNRRGETGKITGLKNKQKTHCPQGHPYSDDNLIVWKNGSRACKICHRKMVKKYKMKKHILLIE